MEDSAAWLQEMSCPETIAQIQRDLAHFPTVDPEKIAVEIPERFGQRQSLCHYTLKDNKVQFVIEICMFVLVTFCFDRLAATSYIVLLKIILRINVLSFTSACQDFLTIINIQLSFRFISRLMVSM